MKVQITESQLKQIIESKVRQALTEGEATGERAKLIAQLKQPGINQAEVARALIKTVWSGMDEDTARSLLSKKVRGEIALNDQEVSTIKRSLGSTLKL